MEKTEIYTVVSIIPHCSMLQHKNNLLFQQPEFSGTTGVLKSYTLILRIGKHIKWLALTAVELFFFPTASKQIKLLGDLF